MHVVAVIFKKRYETVLGAIPKTNGFQRQKGKGHYGDPIIEAEKNGSG